ncbi:hypothetical protein DFP73DRAFT_560779 [Morchella snyderi]|nr:hypothetical protein DFP73DRAFT_560779 [Morchella snyderi]
MAMAMVIVLCSFLVARRSSSSSQLPIRTSTQHAMITWTGYAQRNNNNPTGSFVYSKLTVTRTTTATTTGGAGVTCGARRVG